ncbi:hypothetical protein PHLGIDRAFT_122658 [Phlebiopsis gigantea 11061_1 CR5-6]|uniref:Uncharacterized protein n=1 Tax=Phlebiopsis gigantea (strain 11061_1 CR5-6) TaxID=745531 RepID=A0A0C3S357_PHLG1|nr:hypothetical protein PHLGIDRAFT_122658 [Phlebiopsis gigantea 11061_1 CR5-6]
MSSLKPYTGMQRKVVISFDVGTTFSGIGYAILDRGEVPKIQGVTRFPGQESGDFKIPSVLWYTQDGKVHTAGAEALDPGMILVAEDEDLVRTEWFKLWLRTQGLASDGLRAADLKPLPRGKTVIQVFGDFLAYLLDCTKKYIADTHHNGEDLWASVQGQIDFVLSHPNGWEGAQQSKMRQAAVHAGLVPDTPAGHARVHFVTEGEASILYCLDNGLASDAIQTGKSAMVIDAGGGTVDLSTYKFTAVNPTSVEEIAPSDCIFHGSTRINMLALRFLKAKLANSKYGNDEDLSTMMDSFEKSVKPTFKDLSERSFIKFGSRSDRDPNVGIRSGQLALEGSDIVKFFEPSVDAITAAVHTQRELASQPVSTCFLVGGFAASPWLYNQLKTTLQLSGITLSRPDNHTNKAVAEGAISYFLTRTVAARVARLTYGTKCVIRYAPQNSDHTLRQDRIAVRPSGNLVVPDHFKVLLERGTRMTEEDEYRCTMFREATELSHLDRISSSITCYRGKSKSPRWADTEPEMFAQICTVYADTSRVVKKKKKSPNGPYYVQEYDIVLLCGLTELQAQIRWIENGVEKRGEAKIVYDDDAEAAF